MENLEFSVLSGINSQLNDDNQHPVYDCMIYVPKLKRTLKSVVKFIDESLIVREIYSSCLGRYLNLPTPKPFLVIVPEETKTDILELGLKFRTFAFGTVFLEYPSIRQQCKIKDNIDKKRLDIYLKYLEKWKRNVESAIFDDAITNDDRNIGNLLWTGLNEFALIDHDKTLYTDLCPRDTKINNFIFPYAMEREIKLQHKKVPNYLNTYKDILNALEKLSEHSIWGYLQKENLSNNIYNFILLRIECLRMIFNNRVSEYHREKQIELFDKDEY